MKFLSKKLVQWIFHIFNWLYFESKKKGFGFEVSVFHLFTYLFVWKDTKKLMKPTRRKLSKMRKYLFRFILSCFLQTRVESISKVTK